ncbi:hypothetical protein RF11_04194 [Thelohanellus kitauei]|uniref:Uncharacterized protein n=1 Tax=Thelohanellus kitauei TaxID=669202 RepID=A0A0C2JB79_THEKT|nr:hypothetical protein RF11_04194 [Thelohanellus kitauei]
MLENNKTEIHLENKIFRIIIFISLYGTLAFIEWYEQKTLNKVIDFTMESELIAETAQTRYVGPKSKWFYFIYDRMNVITKISIIYAIIQRLNNLRISTSPDKKIVDDSKSVALRTIFD